MKPYRSLVVAALVAVIALPVAGYAADRGAVKRDADHTMTRAGAEVVESSALIGAPVEARDGKKIGKIVQVLVDSSSGKVHDAVVATGGMAGVGTHKVVVPWSDLKIRNDSGKVVAWPIVPWWSVRRSSTSGP